MKVLHVACFNGNIGDCAQHLGFYQSFKKYVCPECAFTQIEMREFYKSWGKKKFDMEFAALANQHDLVVFGPGSFFVPKWDYSVTATTIDIGDDVLAAIKVPVLFNGIGGVHDEYGASEKNIGKFLSFLKKLQSSNRFFVSLRNDASADYIRKWQDNEADINTLSVPDTGYFISPEQYEQEAPVSGCKNIAVNLAGDMPEIRYPGVNVLHSRQTFIAEFSNLCNKLLDDLDDAHIIFCPHHPADLLDIAEVTAKIKDGHARLKVTVAPLLNGTVTNGMKIFDLYRKCDLVLGMRHHANVCPIGLNVPTLGIVTFKPHARDYDDINLSHRCTLVNRKGFGDELMPKIINALKYPGVLKDENESAMSVLNKRNEDYFKTVNKWLVKAV